MIRAETETVDERHLDLFRSRDPAKDAEAFWKLLRHWYRDPDGSSWLADWNEFVFPLEPGGGPSDVVNFEECVFEKRPCLFRTKFPRVTFRSSHFGSDVVLAETDFEWADLSNCTIGGSVVFSPGYTGDLKMARADIQGGLSFPSGFGGGSWAGSLDATGARFAGPVEWSGETTQRNVSFQDATFESSVRIYGSTFGGRVNFDGARFQSTLDLSHNLFGSGVSLGGAMLGHAFIRDCVVGSDLSLGASVTESLRLASLHSRWEPPEVHGHFAWEDGGRRFGAPNVRFGTMSLARVVLQNLTADEFRFAGAADIESIGLFDVAFPTSTKGVGAPRHVVADEKDFNDKVVGAPTTFELERIYRGLRRHREGQGDRVGSHHWYLSEMEIGRKTSARPLTRWARTFYKVTSDYGLSALRPALWLFAALIAAFMLFSVSILDLCPTMGGGAQCAGWAVRLRVIMLTIFFQPLPDGVAFPGLAGLSVWLLLRLFGVAMLLSIGVAFRNQISR
jgi:uncharacterized protein YjbI with pentapeptide repeats